VGGMIVSDPGFGFCNVLMFSYPILFYRILRREWNAPTRCNVSLMLSSHFAGRVRWDLGCRPPIHPSSTTSEGAQPGGGKKELGIYIDTSIPSVPNPVFGRAGPRERGTPIGKCAVQIATVGCVLWGLRV